ncbi:MAG TPA: hypothetical protein VFI91_12570 [Longimicrobiaceae bacterium]|nr:hypothetical protein [Longimicrobiaceae bacterium]
MNDEPGMWRRVGTPAKGFSYLRVNGKQLTSKSALARIKALAIPPAWTDVSIATTAGAKIQAVGTDAAGRKQYIYGEAHVAERAARKFNKLLPFARALPALRAATNEHLHLEGVGRERVLATVVRLMCRAFFRVGSERYAVNNKTFGLATLKKSHLRIEGTDLYFEYVGKGSIDQRRVVADTPLVEIIREIMDLPGERLFQYCDVEGNVQKVTARDVNLYIKEILGETYTSKDIRTWGGTVRAATILADFGPAETRKQAEKHVVLACKLVSAELGNTPAVCRSAYIHPRVLDGYLAGGTIEGMMRKTPRPVEAESPPSYYAEEAALMRFLTAND